MKHLLFILSFICCISILAQSQKKRVLFLGNSYTYVNNLPETLANAALSAGDTLLFDSNTPGGYTLEGHSTNATSLSKIAEGGWDFVVLQEQSQRPAMPIAQVEIEVFPYARFLDSIINYYNPCGETIFYMTWGRKNGDASNCPVWPPVCTYLGMDSLLNLRYRMMADSNHAILSPVGAVWRYLRQYHPSIDLYQNDGSHPSVAGTYAAACSFYSAIFRNDPIKITYNPSLPANEAAEIRNAARLIVYNNLNLWHIGEYDPKSAFNYSITNGYQLNCTNLSINASEFYWDFGDGNISTAINPIHIYTLPGVYNVKLKATRCQMSDSTYQTIDILVGLKQVTENQALRLVYYPVISKLVFESFPNEPMIYHITDVSGRIYKKGKINVFERQIDISELSPGIYITEISTSTKNILRLKFLKTVFR